MAGPMSIKPRVSVPSPVKAGDIIEIRTLASHVMETGQRRGADGRLIPRNIIHTFTASFSGKEVFRAELNSGISANPYLAFHLKVQASGELVMTWIDDAGLVVTEKADIVAT